MSPRLDIDALSPTELKSLVLKLLEEAAENQRTIGALRDELARLKGAAGPSPRRGAREADDQRGAQARGRCADRLAFQRLCELPRAGSGDPSARHRLSSSLLADPGRQDGDRAFAAGRRRPFRA